MKFELNGTYLSIHNCLLLRLSSQCAVARMVLVEITVNTRCNVRTHCHDIFLSLRHASEARIPAMVRRRLALKPLYLCRRLGSVQWTLVRLLVAVTLFFGAAWIRTLHQNFR